MASSAVAIPGGNVGMRGMALDPLEGGGVRSTMNNGLPHGSPKIAIGLEKPRFADGVVGRKW